MNPSDPTDRRRAPRFRRLIRIAAIIGERFDDHSSTDSVTAEFVTADVSARGAFLGTPGWHAPPGRDVRLVWSGKDGDQIHIDARVVRATDAGRSGELPGFAVDFDRFCAPRGAAALDDFFANVLGAEPPGIVTDGPSGAALLELERRDTVAHLVYRRRLTPVHGMPAPVTDAEEINRRAADSGERRADGRHPTRQTVTWTRKHDGLPHRGVVLDISPAGAFVQTDHEPPALGEKVRFDFSVGSQPGDSVRITGRVLRHWNPATEGLPGFAIQIFEVDERGRTGRFRMALRRMNRPSGARQRKRRGYRYVRGRS